MPTQRTLNELIEDYQSALEQVSRAAAVLEDASVVIGTAGDGFDRRSTKLIDQLNDAYGAIRSVWLDLQQVRPDE